MKWPIVEAARVGAMLVVLFVAAMLDVCAAARAAGAAVVAVAHRLFGS